MICSFTKSTPTTSSVMDVPLQTGVHFQEIEMTVLIHQKFDSTCTRIVHCFGGSFSLLSHLSRNSGVRKGDGLSSTIF